MLYLRLEVSTPYFKDTGYCKRKNRWTSECIICCLQRLVFFNQEGTIKISLEHKYNLQCSLMTSIALTTYSEACLGESHVLKRNKFEHKYNNSNNNNTVTNATHTKQISALLYLKWCQIGPKKPNCVINVE